MIQNINFNYLINNLDLFFLGVFSVLISATGFYYDEGYNSFYFLESFKGIIALLVFSLMLFTSQLLYSRKIIKRAPQILRIIISPFLGVITLFSLFWILYSLVRFINITL